MGFRESLHAVCSTVLSRSASGCTRFLFSVSETELPLSLDELLLFDEQLELQLVEDDEEEGISFTLDDLVSAAGMTKFGLASELSMSLSSL